jgi:hypothetical protein
MLQRKPRISRCRPQAAGIDGAPNTVERLSAGRPTVQARVLRARFRFADLVIRWRDNKKQPSA